MTAKGIAEVGSRIIVLSLILFGLYSIDFFTLRLTEEVQTAPIILLLVSTLQAAILSYPILRARWRGWRLVSAVFLVFYGVTTLMVAIEAVYLPDALPLDLVIKLIVNGAIAAAVFSILAVLIHGRMSGEGRPEATNSRLVMAWTQWLWRLPLIGIAYIFLYVLFGALVFLPLAGSLAPDALADYATMEMPAWVIPFQGVRALLWAALTLPVIRMMRGAWRETGLAVALLYAILMGVNLLRPTGLPVGLQIAHFIEVTGANFVFGWIVVWLLHRRRSQNAPAMT